MTTWDFTKVFANPTHPAPLAGKKHVSVVDLGAQRWIVLDSLMHVDKVPGHLGLEQRNWLDMTLAEAISKPTVMMVHHTLGEKDGNLLDTERFFALVDKWQDPHDFAKHLKRAQLHVRGACETPERHLLRHACKSTDAIIVLI